MSKSKKTILSNNPQGDNHTNIVNASHKSILNTKREDNSAIDSEQDSKSDMSNSIGENNTAFEPEQENTNDDIPKTKRGDNSLLDSEQESIMKKNPTSVQSPKEQVQKLNDLSIPKGIQKRSSETRWSRAEAARPTSTSSQSITIDVVSNDTYPEVDFKHFIYVIPLINVQIHRDN